MEDDETHACHFLAIASFENVPVDIELDRVVPEVGVWKMIKRLQHVLEPVLFLQLLHSLPVIDVKKIGIFLQMFPCLETVEIELIESNLQFTTSEIDDLAKVNDEQLVSMIESGNFLKSLF